MRSHHIGFSLHIINIIYKSKGMNEKITILVVDDDIDTLLFLQRGLQNDYHVIKATNGKEALQILESNNEVDFVITDIMMPVMDGLQLMSLIKGNPRYDHIPVILLSAKRSETDIIAGLKEGADDYITKPFNMTILLLRIRKILEWKENGHYHQATDKKIISHGSALSPMDAELISQVTSKIEANIPDINYSVAQLSNDMGLTRGHLYKKLMAITGKSPLELIRITKLKHGKLLLDQGMTNISEVANRVGISPKQFAHYFKIIYHHTPSEYLKIQRERQRE